MSFSILYSPPPSPHPVPAPLPAGSCEMHCPELDLSLTLSPAPKTDHRQQQPCRPRQSQQGDHLQPRLRPRGQTGKKRNTKVHFKRPVVIVTPEPHVVPHQQLIRAQRRSSERHHGSCSVAPLAAAGVLEPGSLRKPELNSTLALKEELQSLQEAEFNSQKALQETLQKSGRTKTLINARATDVVNVSRSQLLFSSLVSVSVQEDELLSQALQARLMLAPPPSFSCDNKTAEGPSLNSFITSDLFRQKPLPQEEEPTYCKPSLIPCPADSTFDLYRRQRCWEATP